MSTPISGIFALASVEGSTLHQLGKWSINPKPEASEIAHSSTRQAVDQVPGNLDWDGSYMAYGDTPVAWPGSYIDFIGAIGATGTTSVKGRAIVDEFSMTIDVEGGKEIFHEVKFSAAYATTGDQLIDYTANALTQDSTYDPVQNAIGCKAYVGTAGSTELTDVRKMSISIKSNNKAYNSSATHGYTGRIPGNWTVNVSIDVYVDSDIGFSSLPASNSVHRVKLQTNGTVVSVADRFFDISWILFGQKSGIDVDRHSGNIVGCTLNGVFKATHSALGSIYGPASSVTPIWPLSGAL